MKECVLQVLVSALRIPLRPDIVYLYSNMCGHIRTEKKEGKKLWGEESERETDTQKAHIRTQKHTYIHAGEAEKEEKCKSGSRQATRLCAQAVGERTSNTTTTFYTQKNSLRLQIKRAGHV